MIDLLDLPTSYEVKKIYLNKGTNISTILQDKPTFPITFNIISFDEKTYSFSFDCIEEISEGLSSACESICSGKAFIIKDANTEVTSYFRSVDEMEFIYHNGTYRLLKDQAEIQNVCSSTSNVDESFLRKYEESFKMDSHHEVQVAFKQMAFGEFFYKCSPKSGRVKFIYMRADQSSKEIQYYSRKELIKRIPFSSIVTIKFGVNSDVILNTFKNRFQDSSLTIYYKNEQNIFSSLLSDKELHLNFRTERQYDLWGTGLKAIYNNLFHQNCSKKNLLWHSRLFKRFFNNQEFQLIDTFFNNSEVYNKHVSQSWTYEATLLDRRIDFCFEKQQDELKAESKLFDSLIENRTVSQDLQHILPIIFKNVQSQSNTMVGQIAQMKNMINDCQQNKVSKAKEVDLLEINESKSAEDKENQNNLNSDVHERAQKIKYFYHEVFKFQFRLHQQISFLQNINFKLKKYD